MEKKKFIGVYHSETELIAKIDELKRQGYTEGDIYVVAKNQEDISMVRGRTDAEVQTAGSSWMDRFIAFLSGEEPVRTAFRHMGVSDAEADRYYTEVENGGILLYVDHEYGLLYDEERTGGVVDPNLGGNAYAADQANLAGGTYASTDGRLDHELTEEEKLRLHEERIHVNKERVQTGEVHVDKKVVEEEKVLDVPVQREEVVVERRPVIDDAIIGSEDERDAAFKEDSETIRVPITEERIDVTKKPVVKEEIIISKRKVNETETVRDTVLREEANINEDSTKRNI
ncbi:YsnF/AvaK domain-containing protein [Domibacillus epiphyticus]|uniref:Stress response protein YsnF n=1 Tax=Domibacillus epiphyticus TaxID=1714355 RepID=A0A1V2A6D2_9BACI|nr:YsnF/AvaK domain-containing protein [Domibacillus epiphyticus]OMP66565.1 hypothetical protein BTO28_10960 [Domibacillus epiphyticus]